MRLPHSNIPNVQPIQIDRHRLVADTLQDGPPPRVAAPDVQVVARCQRREQVPTRGDPGDGPGRQVPEGRDQARPARRRGVGGDGPAQAGGVALVAPGVDGAGGGEGRKAGLVGYYLPTVGGQEARVGLGWVGLGSR